MDNETTIPRVTIDVRQGRIRIYKDTLRLLGKPDYIQILVNPTEQLLAIRCLDHKERQFHKVDWKYLNQGTNSFEIKCLSFISKFISDFGLEWDCSYRLEGEWYPRDGVAMFPFSGAKKIQMSDGEEQ